MGLRGLIDRSRLIPARAGKTPAANHALPWSWAHPRACGENVDLARAQAPLPGSSPRVRGKPFPYGKYPRLIRLIPARAGKTS